MTYGYVLHLPNNPILYDLIPLIIMDKTYPCDLSKTTITCCNHIHSGLLLGIPEAQYLPSSLKNYPFYTGSKYLFLHIFQCIFLITGTLTSKDNCFFRIHYSDNPTKCTMKLSLFSGWNPMLWSSHTQTYYQRSF